MSATRGGQGLPDGGAFLLLANDPGNRNARKASRFRARCVWHRPCGACALNTLTLGTIRASAYLLVSAIASATFAATLAFAPQVLDATQRLVFGRTGTSAAAPIAVEPVRDCAPLAKIVAVLRHSGDCP